MLLLKSLLQFLKVRGKTIPFGYAIAIGIAREIKLLQGIVMFALLKNIVKL